MAIVPLESAVVVGRSERAYRRDGFLELQERVTEEIAAAVVWLFGVGFLQKQFEKASQKLNPGKNEHLSTHIAWNQPWAKTTHVDLSPQEMFARNKKEINILLGLKSARWLFSVGSALVAVGYLIPKGNQLKTSFILKHLERRKRASEGSNVQFGDPRQAHSPVGATLGHGSTVLSSQASRLTPAALPFFSAASNAASSPTTVLPTGNGNIAQYPASNSLNPTNSFNTSPFQSNRSNIQGVPSFQPHSANFQARTVSTVNPSGIAAGVAGYNPSARLTPPASSNVTPHHGDVRFGGGLPGLSMVQGLGHLVEQTPYGSILVVDAGIAGGRGYVASKRSPYETAEVLFRDIGSLYFYILCVPHLMKLMSSTIDPRFKSSSHLQPKVAGLLHEALKSVTSPAALTRALNGAGESMMAPEGQLRQALRQADGNTLRQLLTQEAEVYLGKGPLSPEIQGALFARLIQHVEPGQIQSLLTAIDEGQEAFGSLGNTERKNLMIAVKQAFRHTVGLKEIPLGNPAALKTHPAFASLFSALEREHPEEIQPLLQRIERMATLDGMNQSHSMLRRSLNLMRPDGNNKALIAQGDRLANWLDEAIHRQQPIQERLEAHLAQLGEQLHALSEASRQEVLHVLNQGVSGSLGNLQNAMRSASTGQLSKLEAALTQLSEQKGKLPEMLPIQPSKLQAIKVKVKSLIPYIKTEAVKVHELKERLSDLNRMLGQSHASGTSPVVALKSSLHEVMATLDNRASGIERDILKTYRNEIETLLGKGEQPGTGRLFALAIQQDDTALGQKLQELLRGGLLNDSRLLSQALDTVGELETDSRKVPGTRNADKMRQAIQDYGNTLMKRLSQPKLAELSGQALQHELNAFLNLNKYLHFGSRGIALATTMACIGWLVPIVQTRMTKQLTGMDNNPGIASAKKQVDHENSPTAAQTVASTASSMIGSLSDSLKKASVPTLPKPSWMPPSVLPPALPNLPGLAPSA